MKITKKFVTGCIMAAAYAVYAAVWLYVLYHGLQPDGASFSQSAGENLQWEGTVMMVSEGILHLMFLLDCWFVWLHDKNTKKFIKEMLHWIFLILVLGTAVSVISGILHKGGFGSFFEPAVMMAFMAIFNLVIAKILSIMDKTAERRKNRYR